MHWIILKEDFLERKTLNLLKLNNMVIEYLVGPEGDLEYVTKPIEYFSTCRWLVIKKYLNEKDNKVYLESQFYGSLTDCNAWLNLKNIDKHYIRFEYNLKDFPGLENDCYYFNQKIKLTYE
jgi:hypothetical protein